MVPFTALAASWFTPPDAAPTRSDRRSPARPGLRPRARGRRRLGGGELRERSQRVAPGGARRGGARAAAPACRTVPSRVGPGRRAPARCLPKDAGPESPSCRRPRRRRARRVPELQRTAIHRAGVGHRARRLRSAEQRLPERSRAGLGVPSREARRSPHGSGDDGRRRRPEGGVPAVDRRVAHRRPARARALRRSGPRPHRPSRRGGAPTRHAVARVPRRARRGRRLRRARSRDARSAARHDRRVVRPRQHLRGGAWRDGARGREGADRRLGRGRPSGPGAPRRAGAGRRADHREPPRRRSAPPRDGAIARRERRGDGAPAGRRRTKHVPATIFVAVGTLALLVRRTRSTRRARLTAPTYALVFGILLVGTHTVSFSVSNLTGPFAVRVTTLCVLAGLAQLFVGGRASVAPAAFVTSLTVLAIAVVGAFQPVAPVDGTLRFVPIPALTSLAFICLMTAAVGTPELADADGGSVGDTERAGRAGVATGLLPVHALAQCALVEPDPARADDFVDRRPGRERGYAE